MRLRSFLPVLLAASSFARGPQQPVNLPITTTFASANASGAIADIQSDGFGSYFDGVGGRHSFLTTNGYNGIVWGDWQFGTLNSTTRKVKHQLCQSRSSCERWNSDPNPPFMQGCDCAHRR